MPILERDLIRMCLLPQQNITSIVNRLLSDGLIHIPKLEKGRQFLLIYKYEMPRVCQKLGYNVQKSALNILLAAGKLGKVQNLTVEMNHLNI